MATNIISATSTVDSLIGAYRSHVLGRDLPEPASLLLVMDARRVDVQVGGHCDLCSQLGSLLVWAYTMADVTARWWRTSGNSLHITVTGRTAGGTHMKVYGGGPFAECRGLVPLAVGETEGVSLDELYALAGLLREAHQRREVA